MKGSLKVHAPSWSRVQLALKNFAVRVPDHAARTMRLVAARIEKKAKDYAPEDTKALVNSIHVETVRGVRGRLELRIIVGGSGEMVELPDGRRFAVDQYAAIIHEHYEDMLVYGPGDRTLEKMEQFPGKVGSGFLTRAAEEEAARMNHSLIVGIKDIIKSENLA